MVGTKPSTSQSCNTQTCSESYPGGGSAESPTQGWQTLEMDLVNGLHQSLISIYINSSRIYQSDTYDTTGALSVTTLTTGGYKYTRGDQISTYSQYGEYVGLNTWTLYSFTRAAV